MADGNAVRPAPTDNGSRGTETRGGEQYERILSAAVELFQAKGYHATSVREIGERAAVSQSSLYYHTRSKPQILVDLNQRFMDRLIPAVAEVVARDEPADAKIAGIVEALMTIVARHQGEVTVVLQERRALPPEAAAQIQKQRDEVDAMIDQVISQGMRQRVLSEMDVSLARLALTGMVNWAYEWYRPGGRLTPATISAIFSRLFLDGISSTPSGSSAGRPGASARKPAAKKAAVTPLTSRRPRK